VARPGGLGRGLGALIPTGSVVPTTIGLQELPVASIRPNTHQPREHFDEEALAALAESIREVGVLQPVLVREAEDGYELIAGERRWRAARRVGLQTIPAIVRHADDASSLQQAIVENVQRESLNPLEEAAAYQQLIEDFELTHDDVATRVGKSRATITNILRLLQLPPTIQRHLQEGSLRMGHARALLATPDRAFQEQLAKRAVAEDMSVRAVEEAVRARNGDAGTEKMSSGGASRGEKRMRPPGLLELEELLGDYLETRVHVTMGPKLGRVVIDFATLEDLERIYRVMTEGSRNRELA
jgi:ParB family chromosome partitioning protein